MSAPRLSLRIETSDLEIENSQVPSTPDTRFSARLIGPSSNTRERGVSFSHGLPSLRISTADKSPSGTVTTVIASQGSEKAKNESRKLLAHLLDQLQQREAPSSVYGSGSQSKSGGLGIGSVVKSMKSAVSNREPQDGRRASGEDDEDDEPLAEFYTDTTYDLMSQLKDVFIVASAQRWNLFSDIQKDDPSTNLKRDSASRPTSFLRRRSMQPSRRRSRSRSTSPTRAAPVRAPELLTQCISVLSSVVMLDCRYQIASPGPLRPPNALQAVTLDIAQYLIYSHQEKPEVVSKIGSAMIYAFYTFKPSMYARLLQFFDESVLGGMLERLARIQRRADSLPAAETSFEEPSNESGPPVVAIMVDEADDIKSPISHDKWTRWSSTRSPLERAASSANAPDQDPSVYYLSALVPPLLAAIVEKVDFFSGNLPTIYSLHQFLHRLLARKPDVYLDILSVIAYHPPGARHTAISLLMTYWTNAVGHVVVTKPFPKTNYAEAVARIAERGPAVPRPKGNHYDQPHPYAHQFVPWRFRPGTVPAFYEGGSRNTCRVCTNPIQGFGLSCHSCLCSVHFDCYDYPEGSFLAQYSVAGTDLQKVALHRFCYMLPQSPGKGTQSIRKNQHTFRAVNIFGLALCFVCRRPLWGCVKQGLRCGNCKHFIHSSCLATASSSTLGRCRSAPIDSTHIFIEYTTLRRSFAGHFKDLLFSEAELRQKSYEEIAIIGAILWTQLQIFNNGLALGSIVVVDDKKPSNHGSLAEFELHYLVSVCEVLLKSKSLMVSEALSDYLAENQTHADEYLMYFDTNNLAYVSSVLKMPPATKLPASGSSDLLSVGIPEPLEQPSDNCQHPLEIVPLAHLRDQLGDVFGIFSDTVARHFLKHLHHLGLLQPVSQAEELFDDSRDPREQLCAFPLPLGFDVSADIETLVAAFEACVQDLDLSINEIGFLLLTRRFWPDGMLSDYTFRRLTKAILSWIFSEDDNLATILRDFVARARTLPGVRVGHDNQPWPNPSGNRTIGSNASSNGGDYVASRRALASRYVVPWLLAFHDKDINAYANIIYDLTTEYAEGGFTDDYSLLELSEEEYRNDRATASDKILRLMMKLCQASVVFTAFDDIFRRWLQRGYILDSFDKPSLSLPKLFNKEGEASQRYSTMVDVRMTMQDLSGLGDFNPLRDLMDTARASVDGFSRGLHWLCLFVASGVEVPIAVFQEFASLARQFKADLETGALLSKATLWSCWMRSMGRQDLHSVIASIHGYLSSDILSRLRQKQGLSEVIRFIRQSLGACLLLFGCDRTRLFEIGMLVDDDIGHLPSRRKMQTRAAEVADPIIVDSALTTALKLYVRGSVDDVSCIIAKFFNTFVNESPLVESYEVDNFILRNSATLSSCAWQFYSIDMAEVSTIRASFMLRVLVVDTQPFQTLVVDFLESEAWEERLQTAHRLFQIITDITSPAFNIEDRQWRSSVVDIFYYFFSRLWLDEREEVRMAVETWSQTLLPSHFDAIALCWNEALNKVPVAERLKLVSFLLQLRPHFPDWRVLSWEAILESLLENDFMQQNGDSEDGPASAYLAMYGVSDRSTSMIAPMQTDSDVVLLQVALTSLSLRMVADGLSIDVASALKLKGHTFTLLGFKDVTLVPFGPSGYSFYVKSNGIRDVTQGSYPCLSDLTLLFDSSHPLFVAPSGMGSPYAAEDETPARLLVGSIFVDLLLEIFIQAQGLEKLPPLTLKNMLKSMTIVIYKHDFDSKPLRHLQGNLRRAIRRVLDLLVEFSGLNHELRQQCLTICQAFIKAWPSVIGIFLCDAVESTTHLLHSLNYDQNLDDPLVEQTRNFLESNLIAYSGSGVINVLFKRRLSPEFFQVLRFIGETPTKTFVNSSTFSRLREALLRDALSRAVENDADAYQLAVENIGKYVEIVYHSNYSLDLLQFVGHSITAITRKTADWVADTFNASPLLTLAATVIQHNKGQCREFLNSVDGFLRLTIVRSSLSSDSLTRILKVTASLYRKAGSPEQSLALNSIANLILEQLTDKLNHKAHITSSTLISLLEVFTGNPGKECPIQLSYERYATLADAGFTYLYSDGIAASSLAGFAVSQAVANLVLQVAQDQPQILSKVTRVNMPLRAWNFLLLAALSSNSTAAAAALFDHFHNFTFVYYRALNAYQHFDIDGPQQVGHADIDRAYASIKLWLLLCRKAIAIQELSLVQEDGVVLQDKDGSLTRKIWNELWPPFESVLTALENDPYPESRLALVATVSSSVADLCLFLRQSRSVIALEIGVLVAALNRVRTLSRSETKINRVLQQLTELPPNLPLEHFVQQTRTELWAEEKLEAAKREDMMKNAPEKMRTRIVS
ncbi:hypothetical protein BXZ70DRAFT_1003857 [Cristinia sonorae]|uniref:Phorbol-ester/DAG-type domain-containing protein n=1 Tax=Cristinia sonorae TaxID=1940300 RepID=A0A8K0XUW9_9AGAR|nr:hypothetical protein BXZ70DRAFT_1003857 [Cristinia sonorae]